MEQILSDLSAVDPKSTAFRYPGPEKDDPERAASLEQIDVEAFCRALEYLVAELEQICEWLDELHPAPLDWSR